MDKWEYRTVYLSWQELKDAKGKKYHDWVVTFSDGMQVEGFDVVLNNEGLHGWELINVILSYTDVLYPMGGSHANAYSPSGYRAIFKRKLNDSSVRP